MYFDSSFKYTKSCIFFKLMFLLMPPVKGQELPLLKVSNDSSYIVTEAGSPFFWLGDTAWEMIHRLDRGDIDRYLTDRAEKGFNIIQTVVLASLDGLGTPNAYGEKPLFGNDPTQINEAYFEHVNYAVDKAKSLGLYVGLLPTWGDKFNNKTGVGPEIFTPENAESYGEFLGKRYRSYDNLVWILGGDRSLDTERHYAIIRAMAKGIRKFDKRHLLTFHPPSGKKATDYIKDEWLDFDMCQTGHSRVAKEYTMVYKSKQEAIRRPIINGEPRYEDSPDRFWKNPSRAWLDAADVRVSAYWTMLSGAAGFTYGCHDVWQMYEMGRKPITMARIGWREALSLPGASQMKYLKTIFELFPWQRMQCDPSLLLNDNPEDESHILCSMDKERDFAFVYTPRGSSFEVDLSRFDLKRLKAYWFNPRSGRTLFVGDFDGESSHEFKPWSDGRGSDYLLILVRQDYPIDL